MAEGMEWVIQGGDHRAHDHRLSLVTLLQRTLLLVHIYMSSEARLALLR